MSHNLLEALTMDESGNRRPRDVMLNMMTVKDHLVLSETSKANKLWRSWLGHSISLSYGGDVAALDELILHQNVPIRSVTIVHPSAMLPLSAVVTQHVDDVKITDLDLSRLTRWSSDGCDMVSMVAFNIEKLTLRCVGHAAVAYSIECTRFERLTSLNMSHGPAKGVLTVLTSLSVGFCQTLRELNLEGCRLHDRGTEALNTFIERGYAPSLIRICLANVESSATSLRSLLCNFVNCPMLEILDLRNDKFVYHGAGEALAGAIRKLPVLSHLNINSFVTRGGLQCILESVASGYGAELSYLSVDDCDIGDEHLYTLSSALSRGFLPKITALFMRSDYPYGVDNMGPLLSALKNHKLRELALPFHKLLPIQVFQLDDLLVDDLTVLDMGTNTTLDDYAILNVIGVLAKRATMLKELTAGFTGLGHQSWNKLLDVCEKNVWPRMQKLLINGNQYTSKGGSMYLKSIFEQ